ncbi:DUF6894 family protein [Mesorhizobium sp. IMUNJ 23232]|uniref:DUF6894 family protein n=1 Tax=Mesorhizobium sp. IMUNJ 23232 TaxID=3376064 RepID=UPI0037B99DCE
MPRFYFDHSEDSVTHIDPLGVEYVNADAAVREAVRRLTALLDDQVSERLSIAVRDETGAVIYRGEAHFDHGWQLKTGWLNHPWLLCCSPPA